MGLFSRSEPRLSEMHGDALLTLHARVSSMNDATSPVSGLRAAMFHLTVAARLSLNQSDNNRGVIAMREIGSIVLGPGMELAAESDGAVVRVGPEGLVIRPAADLHTAMTLERGVPEIAHLVANVPAELGVVCVRETAFLHGDRVRLTAHLVEEKTVVGAGYRSDVGTLWVARSPIVLEEIIDEPRW